MIEIQPYIEIVQIPKGEAPYWVRESLVGLRLPLIERHYDGLAIMPVMTNVSGILSNKPEGKGLRWLVNKRQSIDILAQINGEAAKWLLQNIGLEGSFTFRIDEAAVVE